MLRRYELTKNKFQRHCDWLLYKERHLVEKFFLKIKSEN